MPMKAPPHPGAHIKDVLAELNVNMSEAADALGVTRQQLHNVIAGRSAVSPEMAIRLAKGIGSDAAFWLRLQADHDLALLQDRAASLKVRSLISA